MLLVLAALLAGAAAGAFRYLRPGDTGRDRPPDGRWSLAGARALSWAALLLLVLNPSCAVRDPARPLVLLDGSLSMTAGRDWAGLRAEARAAGDVRLFGEGGGRVSDTLPDRGRSRLGPALTAAAAGVRPVIVITDGVLEDAAELPADLLRRVEVRVVPAVEGPRAAIGAIAGPGRVSLRDTVTLRFELVSAGVAAGPVAVELLADAEVLDRASVAPGAGGRAGGTLRVPAARLGAGDRVLTVALADRLDAEPRDDARLHMVSVSEAPGFVLVSGAPDWDVRFLHRTLIEVTALPVEGYAMIAPGSWRRLSDQAAVPEARVRAAVAGADVVVRHGGGLPAWTSHSRGTLSWADGGGPRETGDWYLAQAGASPLAGPLGLFALDSLAPATALLAAQPGDVPDWVGLTARRDRRGDSRPAILGWQRPDGRREAAVRVQGLWRWAFRGGSGEQAWRALVAGVADWLLGGRRDPEDLITPVRALVPNGIPLAFRYPGPVPDRPVPIVFTSRDGAAAITDSLRFDGEGLAAVQLPPGLYTFAAGSSRGLVGVDRWSEEWFPGPVTLDGRKAAIAAEPRRAGIQDRLWLFGLAVAAFSTEWWLRRRRGLR